jgi:hypothetical protein
MPDYERSTFEAIIGGEARRTKQEEGIWCIIIKSVDCEDSYQLPSHSRRAYQARSMLASWHLGR